MTPGRLGRWDDVRFELGATEGPVHAWFVFEGVDVTETVHCPPENVVLVTAEPSAYKEYPADWLRQFGRILTCQRYQSDHPNKTIGHTGIPWSIGKGYDELIDSPPPPKSRRMSVISTRKRVMKGQSRRSDFVIALERRFGDRIDFFGKGSKPLADKWDGLADYEYSVAIENGSEPAYWTEKITDCFLAATVPLYFGAPDIADFFPDRSFVPIDIEDRDAAFATIEELLDGSDYDSRSDPLDLARRRVLDDHNLFRVLADFARGLDSGAAPRPVTVVPERRLPLLPRKWLKWKRRHLGRVQLRDPRRS